jgi:hypothetical protein
MLLSKIKYINNNPVRKGLTTIAEEWKYSSALDNFGNEKGLLPITQDSEII